MSRHRATTAWEAIDGVGCKHTGYGPTMIAMGGDRAGPHTITSVCPRCQEAVVGILRRFYGPTVSLTPHAQPRAMRR